MSTIARKVYQRLTNFTFAAVLAVSSLTAAMPFVFSQNASAGGTPAVVYDALPSVVPSTNYPSYGLQAHSINEFGDRIVLGGSNRVLNTVTVTMSDWAKYSTYASNPAYNSTSWSHPLTVNVYDSSLNLLVSKEQTVSIPWRPESHPDCGTTSNGTGWKVGDTCYNYGGIAFNATFDLSASNTVVPDDIIVSIEYNTQTRGANPTGAAGPYNSLNITFPDNQAVSVGSDQSTAMAYADASWNNGFGSFSEFETLPGNGTVAFQVTATPVDTSSTQFVNDPKYVRVNNSGDLAAQIVTPDATEDVRFFVDGNTGAPLSGMNVGGAGATTSWWRLYTPLVAGEHEISAEVKVGGVWYPVSDTGVAYSLDTPSGSYVQPNATTDTFRPSDNPVRVKADDEFEQFSKMRVVINGITYEVLRANCDLRQAGNYVLCDVNQATNWGSGLASGTHTAVTSIYTKANNRLDNLTSQPFLVDATGPTVTSFTTPTSPTDATFTISATADDPESGIESVNFYVTAPRESDGVCTGNGTKLYESRDLTADGGVYSADFNAQLNGPYCLNAVARNNARANSDIMRQLVTIDSKDPEVTIESTTTATATPTITGTSTDDADGILEVVFNGTPSTVSVDASGNWSYTSPTALDNDTYTFSVTAIDAVGNDATAQADVTVAVVIITPDNPDTTEEDETETETQTIITPIITPPSANGDEDVQGATDENDQDVAGSAIETPAQVDTDGSDGNIFGLAWYWWIAILAALTALVWGIAAALRRRQEA